MPSTNDGYTPWEELQSVLMLIQNRVVREEFSDTSSNPNWPHADANGLAFDALTVSNLIAIGGGRGRLRTATQLTDNDSAIETLLRLFLFYFVLRKASDLQPPIYGIPVTAFHESLKFYPQVRLYFSEDAKDVESGFHPVESELTFRLVTETSESVSKAEALSLARKIQSLFCTSGGFRWKKGRELWMYEDPRKGYNLQIYAWNETEAKKIIEQILDIKSHTPEWSKYLKGTEAKGKTFATVPGMHTIYGKSIRKPRERPIAYVRFRYAELKLHGLPNDIQLVDRTGGRRNPLVKAN
ncbi:MAG: hypothetical protein H7Z11_15715 [Verrucomicrobia bacterium]|nr:hypothetical protein [Leptolyngbya sp. ES-bin-22]